MKSFNTHGKKSKFLFGTRSVTIPAGARLHLFLSLVGDVLWQPASATGSIHMLRRAAQRKRCLPLLRRRIDAADS
ncbi:hypothetical protein [Cupriavidus sp. amp6]|uniref:hypothetical protein n=1 Tax=Cupriavidus sp. amp6 TaxID=388051 RepID=UPI0018DAFF01|nr:hypothetical protein [Cupriavidus sp. amp6]